MPPLPAALSEVIRDFASPRKRPWLLVGLGFILVLTAWKTKLGAPRTPRPEPDTINFHYYQWLHHKENLYWHDPPRISVKRLTWHLDGKPSSSDRFERIERHELALIRLDYFEERAFDWRGGDLGKFLTAFSGQAAKTDPDLRWSVRGFQSQETSVYFTARKQDIPAIESIIRQVERGRTNRW